MENSLPEALQGRGLEERYANAIGRDTEAALLLVRLARMIAIQGAENISVKRRRGITEEEARAAVHAAASAKDGFILTDVADELCISRPSLCAQGEIVKVIRQEAAGFVNCGMRKHRQPKKGVAVMAKDRAMNPDHLYFPDPDQIKTHVIAFARMMFAHAALEREVRSLEGDIMDDPAFGEQRGANHQWDTRERPTKMVELIEARLGTGLPETEQIKDLLTKTIDPTEQRNLLAHGEWWSFDPSDIEALGDKFTTIEAELYKLRRSIKPPDDAEDEGRRR